MAWAWFLSLGSFVSLDPAMHLLLFIVPSRCIHDSKSFYLISFNLHIWYDVISLFFSFSLVSAAIHSATVEQQCCIGMAKHLNQPWNGTASVLQLWAQGGNISPLRLLFFALTQFCQLAGEKMEAYEKFTKYILVNVLWMSDVEDSASADGFFILIIFHFDSYFRLSWRTVVEKTSMSARLAEVALSSQRCCVKYWK